MPCVGVNYFVLIWVYGFAEPQRKISVYEIVSHFFIDTMAQKKIQPPKTFKNIKKMSNFVAERCENINNAK
jgi:hypothetical protein